MADPQIQQLLHIAGEAFRSGELDRAIHVMGQVVAVAPEVPFYLNDLGILYAAKGQPLEAEQWYRRAIELHPAYAPAHLNLGNALRDQVRWPEAVQAYGHAAESDPTLPDAHLALGIALRVTGRFEEAARCLRNAVQLRPNNPHAYRALGPLLLQLGRPAEALPVLEQLVHLDPRSARARYELGTALAQTGRRDESVARLREAVALDPGLGLAWCNLGLALEEQGKLQEATVAFAEARRLLPQSAAVAYHAAALGAGEPPPSCPPDYLIELFDGYADTFDEHLFGKLSYRGPAMLLEAVQAAGHPPLMDIVDLGCGTGAAGPLFRGIARRLVGVDLSLRMLDKARDRNVYGQLAPEPIVKFLQTRPQAFDLLLAADVFIYTGDLTDVFIAAATALRDGGLFAFTIETIPAGDYVLRPTRRYAQSVEYIHRLARDHGFDVVYGYEATIRSGEGPVVEGAVIVARRQTVR